MKPVFSMCLKTATIVATLLLAACHSSPSPEKMDPHAQLQAEMEKAGMDFSKVMVVRLESEGKRIEVPSVMPTVVAQATVNGQTEKTIFRINDTETGLDLFSRDIPHGSSFKTSLTLDQLAKSPKFTFPVVQADGSLREQNFAFAGIVKP